MENDWIEEPESILTGLGQMNRLTRLNSVTWKRFFNKKEFAKDIRYLSKNFSNSIVDDVIIKDWPFWTLSVTH